MVEGELYDSRASEAIGLSHSEFCLVVESLHDARGDGPSSSEPVEDELLVLPQGPSDLLHRLDPRAHDPPAPLPEELPRCPRSRVRPKALEVFSMKVSPYGLEVITQQLCHFDRLFLGEVLGPFQDAPSRVLQDRLVAVRHQSPGFTCPNLINCLVHARHDVEAIEDVNRSTGLRGDHVEVGLPHVAADELQGLGAFASKIVEKALEALLGPLKPDPQETLGALVDLVDEGQVVVPETPLDLVNADRHDSPQVPVRQPPLDGHLHGPADVLPAGAEGFCDLLPRQSLGPHGKEPSVGVRELTLALGPGHHLHCYTAPLAVHSTRSVGEEDDDLPEGNELDEPPLEAVVGRPRFSAARAERIGPSARSHLDFDRWFTAVQPANFAVNKSLVLFDTIKDSLQQHLCLAPLVSSLVMLEPKARQDALITPVEQAPAKWAIVGWARRGSGDLRRGRRSWSPDAGKARNQIGGAKRRPLFWVRQRITRPQILARTLPFEGQRSSGSRLLPSARVRSTAVSYRVLANIGNRRRRLPHRGLG